jgi:hypothetical protein
MSIGAPAEHRRCAFEGCRKWTVRGSRFCATHPDGEQNRTIMPPTDDRRCVFEGCRKWTMHGSRYCNTHHDGGRPELIGGRFPGNQHARKHGLYATYVRIDGLEEALNVPAGNLRVEIAIVRHVLMRLLDAGLPPKELLDGVVKLSLALVRLLTTNKLLFEDGPDELETAVERYLREQGLGDATESA